MKNEVLMDFLKDETAAKIAAAEDAATSKAEAKTKKKIKALEKEIAELKKKLAS